MAVDAFFAVGLKSLSLEMHSVLGRHTKLLRVCYAQGQTNVEKECDVYHKWLVSPC